MSRIAAACHFSNFAIRFDFHHEDKLYSIYVERLAFSNSLFNLISTDALCSYFQFATYEWRPRPELIEKVPHISFPSAPDTQVELTAETGRRGLANRVGFHPQAESFAAPAEDQKRADNPHVHSQTPTR